MEILGCQHSDSLRIEEKRPKEKIGHVYTRPAPFREKEYMESSHKKKPKKVAVFPHDQVHFGKRNHFVEIEEKSPRPGPFREKKDSYMCMSINDVAN